MINENYQLIKKIGEGGTGEVFLVRHLVTGQFRAAKRFRTGGKEGCLRELRALRNLRHSALPQILDVINTEGVSWLIMEYVPGRCLCDLPADRFNEVQFFDIAEQLGEILQFLHSRTPAVLHLDIKPGNIMLNSDGRMVLIDFGAAVLHTRRTTENPCLGTPGYAAPEQMNPEIIPDKRADIYGYGAVMNWYLHRMTEKKKSEWFSIQKRWKNSVRKILVRSMAEDREQRYADCKELLNALKKVKWKIDMIRRVVRALGAFLIFFAAVLFAASTWSKEEEAIRAVQQESYEELLRRAGMLGLEQAVEYYERAAEFRPIQMSWCFQLLERIAEDSVFSLSEESILKEMLFRIPEGEDCTMSDLLLQTEEYGLFAYRMGMDYWYLYEGTGGRSAAVFWFTSAVEWLQQNASEYGEGWHSSAEIHMKLHEYYGRKETADTRETDAKVYGTYWRNLKELWDMQVLAEEAEQIQFQVAEELLSGIVVYAAQLYEFGVSKNEMDRLIEDVGNCVWKEEKMENLISEAKTAAERVLKYSKTETRTE